MHYVDLLWYNIIGSRIDWLVALSDVISCYIEPFSERGREGGDKRIDGIAETKPIHTTSSAPAASTAGPCPTIVYYSLNL